MTWVSSVPALKANLLEALQARAGLAGVQVSYGWPSGTPHRELIWLGNAEGEAEPLELGAQHHREKYSLDVWIDVLKQTNDQQSVTERAYELQAELEAQLNSRLGGDPTVGGAVRMAQVAGRMKLEEYATAKERNTRLLVAVAVQARV